MKPSRAKQASSTSSNKTPRGGASGGGSSSTAKSPRGTASSAANPLGGPAKSVPLVAKPLSLPVKENNGEESERPNAAADESP